MDIQLITMMVALFAGSVVCGWCLHAHYLAMKARANTRRNECQSARTISVRIDVDAAHASAQIGALKEQLDNLLAKADAARIAMASSAAAPSTKT